ncbi:rsmD [Symbiodinium necroappetens]|jgi:16S rRNA (guanine966-N2)-methyltransferase|uniref:RsmD protein n=1 Tax=Symbiodinium necroappetens TaxID=1628268 RepID=A0A812U779_9DINO|nr:16S rRNA (guanine(966)-N(2))-methyltransferase RsmD [Pseudomonadales bacterium]CAE7565677.1 rsmD [Symbiodinium necroappetens]
MTKEKSRQKSGPSQVRIIGGQWRGRKLPFDGGSDLRPTSGRTRETLFNWLRPRIRNAQVLDLFAGSGSLGLEALSQGASHATFVDTDSRTIAALRANVANLGIGGRCSIIKADAMHFLKRMTEPVDIVFLDPPFREPERLIQSVTHLLEHHLVRDCLYLESGDQSLIDQLADVPGLSAYRQTRSGDAYAGLLEIEQ